jgi:hypothetical protein
VKVVFSRRSGPFVREGDFSFFEARDRAFGTFEAWIFWRGIFCYFVVKS